MDGFRTKMIEDREFKFIGFHVIKIRQILITAIYLAWGSFNPRLLNKCYKVIHIFRQSHVFGAGQMLPNDLRSQLRPQIRFKLACEYLAILRYSCKP